MLKKLAQLLALLGLNSVPAIGWFIGGWSAGTTLGLYWVENVVASLCLAGVVSLHARLNPLRGHFDYAPREGTARKGSGPYIHSFLPIALIFSAAHGIFLVVIFSILTYNGYGADVDFNWREFLRGALVMAGFLVVNFLIALPGLRTKPFSWAEAQGDRMLARVIMVHLTLIFGIGAAAFTDAPRSFFAVFVVLKTLADLSMIFPQWNPKEPPAWLCKVMNKVPNVHPGEDFRTFWIKDSEKEVQRREANEKPWRGRR